MSCAKTAEPIDMQFEMLRQGHPRNVYYQVHEKHCKA